MRARREFTRGLVRRLSTVGLVLCLQLNGYFFAQVRVPHRFGHAFNRQMLPVRAGDFLRSHVPPGFVTPGAT